MKNDLIDLKFGTHHLYNGIYDSIRTDFDFFHFLPFFGPLNSHFSAFLGVQVTKKGHKIAKNRKNQNLLL